MTTAVAFRGEAEFIIAGIHEAASISLEEAAVAFEIYAERELGCDPGMTPDGEVEQVLRLCTDCARKTRLEVGRMPKNIPCYEEAS